MRVALREPLDLGRLNSGERVLVGRMVDLQDFLDACEPRRLSGKSAAIYGKNRNRDFGLREGTRTADTLGSRAVEFGTVVLRDNEDLRGQIIPLCCSTSTSSTVDWTRIPLARIGGGSIRSWRTRTQGSIPKLSSDSVSSGFFFACKIFGSLM